MHHAVLERWSRGESFLHARDPRVKVLILAAWLIALATTPHMGPIEVAGYGAVLTGAILWARLPLASVLARAALVLPFSLTFAVVSAVAGETGRAGALVAKSYLSAAAVLVLVGTTPLTVLLHGLESLGSPRFLILVIQFLYRYLFVISEQAQHMRLAALSRAGESRKGGPMGVRFHAAAGAVATLFTRSHARAEGIHGAMLARGFEGTVAPLWAPRVSLADIFLLVAGVAAAVALRLLTGASG